VGYKLEPHAFWFSFFHLPLDGFPPPTVAATTRIFTDQRFPWGMDLAGVQVSLWEPPCATVVIVFALCPPPMGEPHESSKRLALSQAVPVPGALRLHLRPLSPPAFASHSPGATLSAAFSLLAGLAKPPSAGLCALSPHKWLLVVDSGDDVQAVEVSRTGPTRLEACAAPLCDLETAVRAQLGLTQASRTRVTDFEACIAQCKPSSEGLATVLLTITARVTGPDAGRIASVGALADSLGPFESPTRHCSASSPLRRPLFSSSMHLSSPERHPTPPPARHRSLWQGHTLSDSNRSLSTGRHRSDALWADIGAPKSSSTVDVDMVLQVSWPHQLHRVRFQRVSKVLSADLRRRAGALCVRLRRLVPPPALASRARELTNDAVLAGKPLQAILAPSLPIAIIQG
jgi:hypothetical protein